MVRKALHARGAIQLAAVVSMLVACASPGPGPMVEANIQGTADQLSAFDGNLRSLVGSEHYLVCRQRDPKPTEPKESPCDELLGDSSPWNGKNLGYYFYGGDTKVYKKLGIAINQVQEQLTSQSPPENATASSTKPLAVILSPSTLCPDSCWYNFGTCSNGLFWCSKSKADCKTKCPYPGSY